MSGAPSRIIAVEAIRTATPQSGDPPATEVSMSTKKRVQAALTDINGPVYRPPPLVACEPDAVLQIELPGYLNYPYLILKIRQRIYKNMIVDFSIELHWREDVDRTWQRVCRIVTSHGTVHMHEFSQKTKNRETLTEFHKIPMRTGWNFVNEQYHDRYDYLLDNVEEIMRRWRH